MKYYRRCFVRRYLVDNWLTHKALFAGYTRTGKKHNDIHTNNHLERYRTLHTLSDIIKLLLFVLDDRKVTYVMSKYFVSDILYDNRYVVQGGYKS